VPSNRLAVILMTCGAILASGLLTFTWALVTTSSEAQSRTTQNPDTGRSSHQSAGEPDISNLSTLDNIEGVMALEVATTPQTPTLPPGWTKIEPGGETICSLAANWKAGDDVVILPSIRNQEADKLFPKGYRELKPYFRMTPQPNIEPAGQEPPGG